MSEIEPKRGVTIERQQFFDSGGRVVSQSEFPGASVAEDRKEERTGKSAWEEEHDRVLRQSLRAVEEAKKQNPNAGDSPTHGAYESIERRTRELQLQGHSLAEATAIALYEPDIPQERANEVPKDERPDPKGPWPEKKVESLMRTPVAHGGGSSGGSRFKRKKKGSKVCDICHLEGCGHWSESKKGRPIKEEQPRSEQILFRATPSSSAFVARVAVAAGIPKNDVFAIMVKSICEGRRFDEVVEEWRERYPVKGVA